MASPPKRGSTTAPKALSSLATSSGRGRLRRSRWASSRRYVIVNATREPVAPDHMVRRVAAAALLLVAVPAARAASFVEFESGQVRPLALSPDRSRLFAVNTPDDRLEIFSVDGAGNLTRTGSVAVGLEPVAVAARTNGEVWVVNHLSDSVSVIDVSSNPPRVVRTLLVADEPRDIVFAGTGGNRAFITT